jgi:hypothetical protein
MVAVGMHTSRNRAGIAQNTATVADIQINQSSDATLIGVGLADS